MAKNHGRTDAYEFGADHARPQLGPVDEARLPAMPEPVESAEAARQQAAVLASKESSVPLAE